MKLKELIKKIHKFLTVDIWIIETTQLSRIKKTVVKQVRLFYIIIKDFNDDKCQIRSAALTFRTLLSIVPFFAWLFAVAKGFGVQRNLGPVLLEKITGGQKEIINGILVYIEKTNLKALGYIGFFSLLFIVIGMFSMIEATFNDIWGIKRGRNILRKIGGYLSVFIVIPLFFIIITTINTILATNISQLAIMRIEGVKQVVGNIHLIFPYLLTCFIFVGIYKLIPNTKVKFSAAFMAGIITGVLWQLLQWSYINFQIGVSRYNAIYGAFATFPIFLMWIYISWMVLLFGAEISFAYQNEKNYAEVKVCENTAFKIKEAVALSLMYVITRDFTRENRLQTAETLANSLNVPVRLVRELLFILTRAGFLLELPAGGKILLYKPAKEIKDINIADITSALRNHGTEYIKINQALPVSIINDILKKKDALFSGSQLNKNFQELLEETC